MGYDIPQGPRTYDVMKRKKSRTAGLSNLAFAHQSTLNAQHAVPAWTYFRQNIRNHLELSIAPDCCRKHTYTADVSEPVANCSGTNLRDLRCRDLTLSFICIDSQFIITHITITVSTLPCYRRVQQLRLLYQCPGDALWFAHICGSIRSTPRRHDCDSVTE